MMSGIFQNSSCDNGIYQSFSEQNTVVGYFKGKWNDGIVKLSDKKETYVGEWKNNLYHGYGIQILACGTIKKGLFQEGKFISEWDFPEDFLN
jgi:hypothetical protein